MPETQPFALTLIIGGIFADCVFARSIRIMLILALVGGVFYVFRSGADLSSASALMSHLAARASDFVSSMDPLGWLASLFAKATT